jgi:lipopolysaccharide exporter
MRSLNTSIIKTAATLFSRLKQSVFAKNVGILTVGTTVAQVVAIIVTPFLSRIFTPSDYGLLALFSAVLAVTATTVSLSYPIRIILPKTNHEAVRILLISLLLSILLGVILLLLIMFMPNTAIAWMGLDSLGGWIFIAIIAGVVTAMVNAMINWLNRNSEYTKIVLIRIMQSVVAAFLALTFGFLDIQDGLLYSNLLSILSAIALLFIISKVKLFKTGFIDLLGVAKKHKVAPIFLYPTAMLDVFTNQLPFFLIAMWFTTEITGQYRMAYSLLALPAALIGSAIAQVFYQRFSTVWPDAAKAKELLKKTWLLLASVGLIPFLIIIISGEEIFSFFLGKTWVVAGHMASILALMSYVSLIHSPTSVTMMTMKMDNLLPMFGIATLIHRPLALYLGYINSSIYLGLILFVLFEILHMMCFQYLVLRKLNSSLSLSKVQVL